jgi:hypothetical protein
VTDGSRRLDELLERLRDTAEERTPCEMLDLLAETQAVACAETRRVLGELRWWVRLLLRARLAGRRRRR